MDTKFIEKEVIDKFAVLQEIPVFNGVPVEQLWAVAEKARAIEYDDKFTPFIKENETPAAYFYVLIDGVVVLNNAEQEIATMTENDYYGESELIAGKETYYHTIRLISPKACFIRLPKRLFLSLFENSTDMPIKLSRLISDHYLETSNRLAKEIERNRNIDAIMHRFNMISTELMRAVGREEVEQKFLLKDNFDIKLLEKSNVKYKEVEIDQAYLKVEGGEEERIRRFGDSYFRTVKYDKAEGTRKEQENRIDKDDFEKEYKRIKGTPIQKTRYIIQNYPQFKELCIDIYEGKLKPLKVAEIEYWSEEHVGNEKIPGWLDKYIKKEVTKNDAYKNKNLALKGLPKR